jgi:hypothetical protein
LKSLIGIPTGHSRHMLSSYLWLQFSHVDSLHQSPPWRAVFHSGHYSQWGNESGYIGKNESMGRHYKSTNPLFFTRLFLASLSFRNLWLYAGGSEQASCWQVPSWCHNHRNDWRTRRRIDLGGPWFSLPVEYFAISISVSGIKMDCMKWAFYWDVRKVMICSAVW